MLVFLISRFIPGNVIDLMVSEMSTLAEMEAAVNIDVDYIRHQLGLDVPIHVQSVSYTHLTLPTSDLV